ncbi:timing of cab expression 1 [Hordeum vulgare]|uniref:Pseudo-response regulator 1 n=4 Tax=Hordeum vulgare TaxID=4513 RepID=G9C4W0_HORVV|nr:timing of cab expression 1 [Hordeum vulgare subsp. vulgare]KAE8783834.1 timing of cab expression 1 [Hordeum vulgare]QSG30413.1 timing of cab expression 1 [Hordeum vulgare subsp. vulgare]
MVGAGEGGRAGGSGAGVGAGAGQPFVDRSKVRILLCDSDPDSSQDVLRLLCNCSYQVTCAKSPRQVINVLNCEGAEIDIILAEVDLPVSKCFKMLKYIGRNKELRHIPIIMMSNRDEVSVVVKCLRLGAAEYLVKPLRMNELLNLWTHVWRRRRMLGLAEKNFFIDNLELVLSEPSDANTNSTTLLSDETDDKPKGNRNHETNTSSQYEYESPAADPPKTDQLENLPSIAEDDDNASSPGGMFSRPIKTNLRIAESSAFLAYVKSSTPANSSLDTELQRGANKLDIVDHQVNFSGSTDRIDTNSSTNIQDEKAFEMPTQYPLVCFSSSNLQLEQRNEGQQDVSGNPPVYHYPFYYPGMVEHSMALHSVQSFQGNINTAQAHTPPTMLHQYSVYHQSHGASTMPSYQYNPAGMNVHSSHLSMQNVWSSVSSTPIPEERHGHSGRRAAALAKFRQKRKDRCFDKKVRYVNRKKLAETRPRVRGQFVRQASNTSYTDIISTGDDISEYEDDDPSSRDVELVSSPE